MAVRELRLETNGANISITRCEWSPLEILAGLQQILDALRASNLPLPEGIPDLILSPTEDSDGRTDS